MKVIFPLSVVVCVAYAMALPSKVSTTYSDNYPAFKADFTNLNPDNIYIRILMDLDNRIRRCIYPNSIENILTILQNTCVPPKCDFKKLLWYMDTMYNNAATMADDSWNNNKVKKNFDEIDKTSASFSTLNQLI
ncbi:uncharacterized protein LOC101451285 isoform X1 [Ceratitis capitata]|uniref:(Mediterranean fruit fly) hypothetical protein n=1 Tax=Ceratitis capitata TaxID=7213 RepID=A0A811VAY3_CERCA|nr:uncharacterized protein LOC101451285 isoform X1 [Ceratitis capitata]CAD7013035.1 unnamed protein product [Ceratitis capitata]